MVSIRELLEVIEQKDAKIGDLRDKIGNLSQSMTDAYLNFAVIICLEIGKLNKIDPKLLDIRILLDGKILMSAKLFHLEFANYSKALEHLLCMVRLMGIEDGAAVVAGKKDQANVYFEMDECYQQGKPEEDNNPKICISCGRILPPNDPNDPVISDLCESCYQNGET